MGLEAKRRVKNTGFGKCGLPMDCGSGLLVRRSKIGLGKLGLTRQDTLFIDLTGGNVSFSQDEGVDSGERLS